MEPAAGLVELEALFRQIINISVAGAFVALVVMMFLAGIKFLTSGGEPNRIKSASDTVTWALLGMLFLVIAWLVLQLIQAFTGVHLTDFNLQKLCPSPGTVTPTIPGCP